MGLYNSWEPTAGMGSFDMGHLCSSSVKCDPLLLRGEKQKNWGKWET